MNNFSDFLQFFLGGLTSGAIYALIALGFCVVHNTMGIVNFVQVDFVTLGGMCLFSALFSLGLPMAAGLPLALLLVALVAMLLERIGLRPARSSDPLVLIFLTVGLSIILRGAISLIWGKNRMALPPLTPDRPIALLGATVLPQTLWILLLTLLAIGLLSLFFYRTSLGLAMRAVACNPTAAAVVGIAAGRVRLASYALAGALGGLAGVLVTPITTLSYDVGVLLGLKGFAAAILGGFGSFPGAIVGGVGLGLLEAFSAGYLSSAYKDVVAFVVLLLVLALRPQGLLGRH
ncbi:branched-chain amino acid ABC transporter permease [Desulfuromonas thiophila]|uniref:Amino acid/amide ABC transporter membrane protein 1, HAAT family n=1 Tax=Desulfuromonas thiophila TaxID=57664 RepID=A0A1G7CSX4_9BACT|nr:branched-chain amino acid ABC transporter permease [Desulfuromonas thiophila]MDD3802687.1 branched-chain amino acid ABC transporter permease [Desulfuromonas thiophila]MDY0397833.1 branched-chain amino acid ABC transporter permease [Desulfuromonas thiophila]SDE41850.1 amino acid/amide ABC transporter membrane protein 1, HAAT family [Desulfuromonas thiophila]